MEKLHLSRNQSSIRHQQSYLQKGFTEGEASSIAGLVLTELNIEAKEKRNPVYIALTDAKKAFDIGLPPFLKIGHPIPVFNVFGISAF
jgi:hypothetical protein